MASLQQQLWDGAPGLDLIKIKQAIAAGVNVDAGDPNNVSGLTGVVRQLLVAAVGRASDLGMDVRDRERWGDGGP